MQINSRVGRPPAARYTEDSFGTYVVISILMAIMSFVVSRYQGQEGTELSMTIRSSLYAAISTIPIIIYLFKCSKSLLARIFIIIWWPVKIAATIYYVFSVWDVSLDPSIYLKFSDNLPWHEAASRVNSYWSEHGVSLIPKGELIKLSINYPLASYFFGASYYSFGPYLPPFLPWLSFFVFLSAGLSKKILEGCGYSSTESNVAFYYILCSPVLWLYTLIVQRDPLIIFVWMVIAYLFIRQIHRDSVINIAALVISMAMLANLRSEYLYVLLLWLTIVLFYFMLGRDRASISNKILNSTVITGFIIFIGLSIWGGINDWYVTKYDISGGVANEISRYLEGAGAGKGIYGRIMALGGAFLLPIILPFKLLIGLTAPFPWNFSTFELSVTQPFYSLESIIRITLFYFAFKVLLRWRLHSSYWSMEAKLILILGALVGIAGLLGPLSEVRYLSPAMPLLMPLFIPYAATIRNWLSGIFIAITFIMLLQVLYYLIR